MRWEKCCQCVLGRELAKNSTCRSDKIRYSLLSTHCLQLLGALVLTESQETEVWRKALLLPSLCQHVLAQLPWINTLSLADLAGKPCLGLRLHASVLHSWLANFSSLGAHAFPKGNRGGKGLAGFTGPSQSSGLGFSSSTAELSWGLFQGCLRRWCRLLTHNRLLTHRLQSWMWPSPTALTTGE